MKKPEDQLILAPIRGITSAVYRNAWNRHFGGAAYALAPYVELKKDRPVKINQLQDVDPLNNELETTGQILTKEVPQFVALAQLYTAMGVKEVNLNMGCPYPMVTNRGKGSGLLGQPAVVQSLLQGIQQEFAGKFSVKLRLGKESKEEIDNIIPILNDLPLVKVIIHPRLGRQLYQGSVDLDSFSRCLKNLVIPPVYNGDINSVADFQNLKKMFPPVNQWMIGRGVLCNPALFLQIKGAHLNREIIKEKLAQMHAEIVRGYLGIENGRSHFLVKMKALWGYLSQAFQQAPQVMKKIKKAQTIEHYNDVMSWVFDQEIADAYL